MTQRILTTMVIVATVFTVAVGCARHARTSATTPAASPSTAITDLVGTWQGTAWELAGAVNAARTQATVQLNADQTWSAHWKTNQGKEQTASGTYTAVGDRVMLKSASGGSTSLKHRGDQLYGMLDSAVAGLDVELDLKKVQ